MRAARKAIIGTAATATDGQRRARPELIYRNPLRSGSCIAVLSARHARIGRRHALRVAPMNHFRFRAVDVRLHGIRQDIHGASPP
jgi:hypothetical protein